ncbi:MAG: MFS transporter [Acidimicrobiia bacterium]
MAPRRVLPDLAPLRQSRDFRLLWTGLLVSESGSQITTVAIFLQVYALTQSSAAVGLVGVAQVVPIALAAIVGGPHIDARDRRRILLAALGAQIVGSAVLFAAAASGSPPLVLVYAAAAVGAGGSGLGLATRASITPTLFPADQLPKALVLNQAAWNTCLIVGPALGGVIVARFGFAWAYGVDVASFSVAIMAALLMAPKRPDGPAPEGSGWRRFTEGIAYLRGRPVLWTVFVVDLVAMIFGMPRAVFPELAATQFGVAGRDAAQLVGLLFSALAVGALLGALTAGWVGRVRRQGRAVLIAVAIWGGAIACVPLTRSWVVLAVLLLAVAGGADVISAVFRGTILQTNIPDTLRGRMSAVNTMVVIGGPRLGDAEAGLVAAFTSPGVAVATGGIACVVGVGVLALAVPAFARYVAPPVVDSDPVDGGPPDA